MLLDVFGYMKANANDTDMHKPVVCTFSCIGCNSTRWGSTDDTLIIGTLWYTLAFCIVLLGALCGALFLMTQHGIGGGTGCTGREWVGRPHDPPLPALKLQHCTEPSANAICMLHRKSPPCLKSIQRLHIAISPTYTGGWQDHMILPFQP